MVQSIQSDIEVINVEDNTIALLVSNAF